MALLKYLFELALTTIILFFLWNILKRLFFNSFYKNFPQNDSSKTQQSEKRKDLEKKINWDAETVDFEEIKEDKTKNNQR